MDHPIYRLRLRPFYLLRGFKKKGVHVFMHVICLIFVTSTMLWLAGCQSPQAQNSINPDVITEKVVFSADGTGITHVKAKGYEMNLHAGKMDILAAGTSRHLAIHFENASSGMEPEAPAETVNERIYRNLYEKTDLRVYDKGNGMAGYDFILAPGASSEVICLKFEGEQAAYLDKGELVQPMEDGSQIRHTVPIAYQEIDGERIGVESAFRLEGDCLGFEVGEYNPDYALTIDPSVYRLNNPLNTVIERIEVSDCYYDENLNQSMAAVAVEVSWDPNTAPGPSFNSSTSGTRMDRIEVKLGSETRYIYQESPYLNSGFGIAGYKLLSPPQVVTFFIPANGTSFTVTTNFITTPTCITTSASNTLPAACDPVPCVAGNGIGGNVFEDFSFNGTIDPGDTEGVEGIIVNVYDCDAAGNTDPTPVGTATSDVNGDYYFSTLVAGTRYRIEFTIPAALSYLEPTCGTSDNYSAVQFAVSPSCGVNFGVNNKANFCQPQPYLFTTCYVRGDATNSAGFNEPTIVRMNYGVDNNSGSTNAYFAKHGQTGAVWGLAYDRKRGLLYSSSVLRRHVGLGPQGLGGIYVTQVEGGSYPTSNFMDLDAAPYNFDFGTEPARVGLSSSPNVLSYDGNVFDDVGKMGMGDIDYNEATDELYLVNLQEKKLYQIDMSGYLGFTTTANTTPGASDVASYDIPDPCNSTGNMRPWAVKATSDGKVYIGLVCDGANSGERSDLRAYVYVFDPVTNSFNTTPVMDFPLTYPKGAPAVGNDLGNWNSWSDDIYDYEERAFFEVHPQPILSDIEFDVDGSMVLAFMDRAASLQIGSYDGYPDNSTSQLETGIGSGDILRAYGKGGVFILENNAQAGPATGYGPGNSQGPGFGEFYNDDWLNGGGNLSHAEIGLGGIALAPGTGQVVGTFADPYNGTIWSAGTRTYNNSTGQSVAEYVIYKNNPAPSNGGQFGKGGGLGDLEMLCDTLEKIEIGNYIWWDRNRNGVQDPCELPLPGVNVSLYNASKSLISTTITGPEGQYYFSSENLVSGNPEIEAVTSYFVVFGTGGQVDSRGVLFDSLVISPKNTTLAHIDSDLDTMSTMFGGLPFISFTTPKNGKVDHTLDGGFGPFNSLGNLVWLDYNGNGSQDPGEPGIAGVELKLQMYVTASNSYVDATDINEVLVPNQTTDANGNYLFELLPDSIYRIVIIGSNWITGPFSPTGLYSGFEGTSGDGGDTQDNSDDNGDQDGVHIPNQIVSQNIDLRGGQEPIDDGDSNPSTELSIDFGVVGYNLGNYVWFDADNSGHVNAADGVSPGISGVTVQLLSSPSLNPVDLDPGTPGVQSTVTTDANGFYLFEGIPAGNYRVRLTTVQFSGALANHYSSTGINEEDNPNSDGDQNDNGLDPGDAGYPGSPSANGILSGVVTIGPEDVEPTNEVPIPPATTAGEDGTNLVDGRSNQTVDFGLYTPVSLGDIVFVDTDGDGTQNSGTEPTIGGVTLKLLVNNGTGTYVQATDVNGGTIIDITTSGTGQYCFQNLPPGEYIVRVVGNTSGYESPTTNGGDPDGNASNDDNNAFDNPLSGFVETSPVSLIVGDEPNTAADGDGTSSNKTVDLGFQGYSLGNYVWLDADGSGNVTVLDGATPGIPNVTLQLLNAAGNPVNQPGTSSPYTTTTDANGFYQFYGLAAGSYRVRVAASNFSGGLSGMYPSNGPNDNANADSDMDQDDNGLDNGDTGYPGAFATHGVRSSVVTLGGIDPEPLSETPTQNGAAGNDNHGTSDANSNLTVDFGFYSPVEIGDLVWYDENVDGTQDGLPNEPGISSVAVSLQLLTPAATYVTAVDVNGNPVANQNTNGSGNYCFGNLPPGTYRVALLSSNWNAGQVFGPGGTYAGAFGTIGNGGDDGDNTDDNGNQDFISTPPLPIVSEGIQLIVGDESGTTAGGNTNGKDPSIDFGMSRGMAIGNRIWFDTNNNGILDPGEQGPNGVTVQLYEADIAGNPATFVDELITCGGGYYLFPFLTPDDYVVLIPASNFSSGGGLEGYHSSLTTMNGSGVLTEIPAPAPNVDQDDNDDNGTKVLSGPFNGAVRSGVITLDPTVGEPISETDPSNICVGGVVAVDQLTNETIDFGFYRAAVGNLVWIDHESNDGLFDNVNEGGFGNVQVRLFAANGITEIPVGPDGILGTNDDATGGMLTSSLAASLGEYCFNGLAEGDYVIKLTTPYGYTSSSGTNGSATGTYEPAPDPDDNINNDDNGTTGIAGNTGLVVTNAVSLQAGNGAKVNNTVDNATGETKDATVDFALYQMHSVGNHVYYDTDNSNSFDMGEQGADGVTVQLYNATTNAIVKTTATANNGYYLFPFLQPGDYYVVLPATNFVPTGQLACYHSTGTSINGSGVRSETAAVDPDGNVTDGDDNGALATAGIHNGGVASPVFSLNADEPLLEPATPGYNLPGQDPSPDIQGNYTVDFGFYKGLIGDVVFEDLDNNGERQLTEQGLGNVEVRLYAADGSTQIPAGPDGILGSADDGNAPMLTSNSAATRGQYCFSGLAKGEYIVKVSVPAGYATSTGNNAQPTGPYEAAPDPDDNEEDDDNGSEEIIAGDTLATSLAVSLDPGALGAQNNNEVNDNDGTTKDPSVDFALFPTFSLGNMVYYDTDNSSSLTAGEQGVDGITVELYYANGQGKPTGTALDTATTANGGFYCFAGLRPDVYVVVLIADNFDPATGVLRSHHSSGTSVNGSFVRSETTPASPDLNIDGDDNGALNVNPLDPFFGAVVSPAITLDWPLPAGEEAVNESPREAGKAEDTPDRQSNYTVDFGFYKTAIGDLVFDDNDNSGTITGAEGGYPGGATIKICAADGVTAIPVGPDGILGTSDDGPTNPVTSASGSFRFDGLPAGEYVIKLELPVGYVSSSGINGHRTGPYEEPAPDADNGGGDNVNNDDNGTTSIQATDPLNPGEVATLPVTLNPGDAGANTNNVLTHADGTSFDPTVDLAIYRVHSLGNVVFFDTDNSADRQTTEVGVDGVEVELFDNNGAFVYRDSTQSGGNYLFRYLAPAFQYRAVITAANFGAAGTLWGYYSSGTSIDNNGNQQETAAPDPDANASDSDDNGFFQLGGAFDGSVASALVTLGDGEPTLEGSHPTAGRPDPTTPDNQSNVTVDFGFYTGGLGNLVWDDTNNNGSFDSGEPRVPGMVMELYAADKNTKINVGPDGRLGTADDNAGEHLTAANGTYRFRHLPEGNYYIILTPVGDFDTYISSTGTVGSATGPFEPAPDPETLVVNNDDNGEQQNIPAVGGARICTQLISLDPGNEPNVNNAQGNSEDRFIDLGIWNPLSIGNFVWEDNGPCNIGHGNNGAYDPTTESGIDGVELCVYYDNNQDGEPDSNTPILTDITADGGFYLFDYLIEGNYVVWVKPSNFGPGAPLDSMISSTVTESDPNLDFDNNDNGIDNKARRTLGIYSGSINLLDDNEPENEDPLHPLDEDGVADDDNANMAVDFGFVMPGYYGDYAWDDVNHDGYQGDPSIEPPVEGMIVRLYQWLGGPPPQNNILIAIDTTDANGKYFFEELAPCREYSVTFGNFPQYYEVTSTNMGPNDSIDSDALDLTFATSITMIEPEEVDMRWDAGIYLPTANIGDHVWEDLDEDGYQENGEPPVEGVIVVLHNCAGDSLASDTTDALGRYLFEEWDPGSYYVEFRNIPAGYVFSPQDAGNWTTDSHDSDVNPATGRTVCTHLDPHEEDLNWDAGIYLPKASLGNKVWHDVDEDGKQGPNEPGKPGIRVVLYNCAGDSIDETTTNAQGFYLFDELTPGDYYVAFRDLPVFWDFSPKDNLGNDDVNDSDVNPNGQTDCIHLDPKEDERDVDAGIYLPKASIGDKVWEDLNENGIQDPGEPGVAGLFVVLTRVNTSIGYLDTVQTDPAGRYYFSEVPPGDYYLEFFQIPAGYVITQKNAGSDPAADSDVNPANWKTDTTLLSPNEDDPTWDLGIYMPKASLGNKVFEDEDEDGIQDPTETGVSGIRVVLHTCNGDSLDQTFTDNTGEYNFDGLTPGDYYVIFKDIPSDYVFSPKDAASNDALDSDADVNGQTACTHLDPGEDDETVDAGIYKPLASISDCVWYDLDEDGVQDVGENGIAGVTVKLYKGDGTYVDQRTTTVQGKYLFDELEPGDYYLEFSTLPNGFIFSPQDEGGDDSKDSDADPTTGKTPVTTLDPDENDENWDAGIYEPAGILGCRVWEDHNGNGAREANEPGVPGVKVILYTCAGDSVGETYTAIDGAYLFEALSSGNYYMQFVNLPGSEWLFSPQNAAGVNDTLDSDADANGIIPCVYLAPREDNSILDVGIYFPQASLGDKVWEDDDKDGEQDPSETGVPHVRVVVYNCAGDSIDQQFTDVNGVFLFEELAPGDYYVVFKDLPTGYGFSPQDATTDGEDSDADASGQTACIHLNQGDENRTLDAGIIPPTAELGDYVWEDIDEDGQQDSDEPPVIGVRVVLHNCNGDSITQQLTAADGSYLFSNLPGGDYYLVFKDIPAGYEFTVADQGTDGSDSDAGSNGQTACIHLAPGQSDRSPDAGVLPEKLKVCEAEEFMPNGFAMIFTSGAHPGVNPRWNFDANGGEFTTYVNGTARLTGTVVNHADASLRYCVELRLIDKRDWGQWTALGHEVKAPENGPSMSWEFLQVDSLHSRLIGKGSLAGDTMCLSHEPINRKFGFQLGDGANAKTTDYGLGGWFRFVEKATGNTGTGDFNVNLDNCVNHSILPIAPQLGALALLQGPYDQANDIMRADLKSQGVLSASQPFSASPWNYSGTETIGTQAPDSIVDWVLVELRDVNDARIILSRQAGLLLQRGQIVQPDGHSLMEMPQGISSAYLVVYNWNHLPVMSAQPLQKFGNVYFHDFTEGMTAVYQDLTVPNQAAVLIPGGISLLYEGDATGDGQVNSLDLGQVMTQYFNSGAFITDVNLDGVINSLDVARSMRNYFKRTHVPR